MKTFLIIVIISFVGLFQNNNELEKCHGFEEFTFGSSKQLYKNLTLELEEGNSQLYTVNSTTVKLNGVQLDYFRVTFIKNKLTDISISTKNTTGAVLFKYLKDNYGSPKKLKNRFEWIGNKVHIVFELYNNNKDAYVDFYSNK
jgi:hypothetical protein